MKVERWYGGEIIQDRSGGGSGGGGTLGSGTVAPTWNSGALASCTATAGDSSGCTVTIFTNEGTGGDGAPGGAEFSGW